MTNNVPNLQKKTKKNDFLFVDFDTNCAKSPDKS